MERDLAAADAGTEAQHAELFEEPVLLTLGVCYERNGRFAGGVYRPALQRTEEFLDIDLADAVAVREERAEALFRLDAAVAGAVEALKARGFESPYLKNFVVARIDPLRFKRGATAEFDATIEAMIKAAERFDASKVKVDQVARSGGPVED